MEKLELEEEIGASNAMHIGPLALAPVVERSSRRDERAIKEEIRALEAEQEALKHERRHEKDYHFERRKSKGRSSSKNREEVKIEKDRKGRMSLVVK